MKTSVLILALWLFLAIGWIKGLVNLCQCDFEPSYKAEVIYGVGTITGLNCIVGWFNWGK